MYEQELKNTAHPDEIGFVQYYLKDGIWESTHNGARLEVWSDGTLPFNLKPEDLKKDHASRPRNPIIAQVFYLRGMIERWGRGTQKIVELCVKAGHPEPEFGENE